MAKVGIGIEGGLWVSARALETGLQTQPLSE